MEDSVQRLRNFNRRIDRREVADEIESLRQRAERALAEVERLNRYLAIAKSERQVHERAERAEALQDKAEAELEALRKAALDAKRYQWLRAQHWSKNGLTVVNNPHGNSIFLESLDAVIDAAMAREGEK